MEGFMIEANEQFFSNIKNLLSDGGVYVWKDTLHQYTKSGDYLECNEEAYNSIKDIVTEEFLINNFKVKEDNV